MGFRWNVAVEGKAPRRSQASHVFLGRTGYVAVVASSFSSSAEELSALGRKLMERRFLEGHRYTDFDPGKDALAEADLADVIVHPNGAARSPESTSLREMWPTWLAIVVMIIITSLWEKHRRRRSSGPERAPARASARRHGRGTRRPRTPGTGS
ncbi:MAG: DUF2167 domain-containing protein [Planctomycetota bacterium]